MTKADIYGDNLLWLIHPYDIYDCDERFKI